MQKIGIGRDIHRLVPDRKLFLGGLEIPHEKGLLGHSDGDVLCHAIIDALLGAAAMGDIGEIFPPSDPQWKNANSLVLLKKAWNIVREEGWNLVNLDCIIICESPKILPIREKIRSILAHTLETDIENVFVKGKTNEGLGDTGKGEAIEALAICLLEKTGT